MNDTHPTQPRRRRRSADHSQVAAAPPAAPRPGRAPEDRLEVRLLQILAVLGGRMYHRTRVLAPQRLPRKGPAILVCNHISGLDPLLIQSTCPRLIIWMMAKEYYEIKSMKWLFRAIDAIPVDRSGRDMAATRAALRALDEGRVLGIFPEGRIETSRDLLPFQSGVALLAIKTGVPVFPAYLDGTQRGMEMLRAILTPNEAALTFGPPVEFDRNGNSREALQAATHQIQQAVQRLRTPSPHGDRLFGRALRQGRKISAGVDKRLGSIDKRNGVP